MLKHLAILAVSALLAVNVADQSNKDASPDNKPAKQEQPATHSVNGIQRQSDPANNQTKAGDNAPAGNAPVERPQWWGKSEWWLVIIAGLTGCAIGWQSWETRKAAHGATAAAEAALQQTLIMKSKERARLIIELADLKLDIIPHPHKAIEIHWSVVLYGQTDAFVHKSQCFAGAEGDNTLDSIKRAWGEMAELPAVIGPHERRIAGMVLVRPPRNEAMDYEVFSEILRKKECIILCSGFIEYSDVFGSRWIFRFKRRWEYFGTPSSMFPHQNFGGEWAKYGNQEDNGEYPVPSPKPN